MILAEQGVLPGRLLAPLADEIEATDRRILPGITSTTDEPALEGIQRVGRDLREFRAAYGLSTVVVVNVATTEAPTPPHPAHPTLAALETALAAGEDVLPPSSLYAYAALDAGCPFVDFTPSLGARLPALEELARLRGVPHAGRDGKTGETLVKSALAPMFADRALLVRSWSGTNLLGGGDGAALAEPGRVRSKLDSKGRGLAAILGYEVEAPLRIEYVADLGEWKTAWDHIGFEGFLGTRMRMQFTWEGCDSALAAPLVVDLARLVARAHVRGEHGALPALAFFFKDPVGTAEQRLDRQFALLCDWATRLGDGS
jgi:myo-inositol-1-phosphate synthase